MIDKELIAMCDCPEIQDRRPVFNSPGRVLCFTRMYSEGFEESAFALSRGKFDSAIYIPRIEDIWGWYGANMYVFLTETLHPTYFETSIELLKGLLKRHMHLSHNKTWDGEKWA